MTVTPAAPRWVTFGAGAVWLATLLMGLGVLWVGFATDYLAGLALQSGGRATGGADNVVIVQLTMAAFCAVTLGYASVGALLVGRPGAGRIGSILLLGGALFILIPFGWMVGGFLTLHQPQSALYQFVLRTGIIAIGPGCAAILPLVAIAFPDGSVPSPRWRGPVYVTIVVLGLASLVQLVRPDTFTGVRNPFAIDAVPALIGQLAEYATAIGVFVFTAMGITAVVVRYRRGTNIERQQVRWFLAAVVLAAFPLSLTFVPGLGGPIMLLVASFGLILVPISVGIAVSRYRLYEIDHLINRTLVYVPLTALVAGLYAASVALLQRVFQSVTGDRSDAAIVISTLILASVFTPLRKWLEGIVDRRFKPATPHGPVEAVEADSSASEWEERMAAIALRVVRTELDARPARAAASVPIVMSAGLEATRRRVPDERN